MEKGQLTAAKIIKQRLSVDSRQRKWHRAFLFAPGQPNQGSKWINQGKLLRQP